MQVKIGDKILGKGHPTFIVAEMSGNHGGSLERALEIVRAAKITGADAIKLQTYTADTITLKSNKDDFTLSSDSPNLNTNLPLLYPLSSNSHPNAITPSMASDIPK